MASFAQQQEQLRSTMQKTMGGFLPFGLEEVGRQNMAMMERAMGLFAPFYSRPEGTEPADLSNVSQDVLLHEIERLRTELAELRAKAGKSEAAD